MLRLQLHRSRILSLPLLSVAAACMVGSSGCGIPFEFLFGGGFLPDVTLDTSDLERSGFSRTSLAGSWVLTNSSGQTRRARFDVDGNLTSFELPSDELYTPSAPEDVEVLDTSFGALSIVIRGPSSDTGNTITVYHFEGFFSDEGDRIQGTAVRVADDLTGSRVCNCNETWVLETE